MTAGPMTADAVVALASALTQIGYPYSRLHPDRICADIRAATAGYTLLPTPELAALRDQAARGALADEAISAIRELLTRAGVPVAAFVDDHVRNAVVQRNQARAEVERLREALVDHNDRLRSVFHASQRDATHDVRGTTNYRLLADRCAVVLDKHHATTNFAREAINAPDGGPQ